MPVLTNPKQERFAQELAKGTSASEAYEIAGYKPNRHNAAALAREQHILARTAELLAEREQIHAQSTAEAIQRVSLTKEWVIATLIDNVQRAMQAEPVTDREGEPTGEYTYQGTVANRSLELLGKELGMFVDRKVVQKIDPLDDITDPDILRRILAERAERIGETTIAARLARGEGPARGKIH